MNLKEKITNLIAERDAIIYELNEIQKAYDNRQRRMIEIDGSIKILQELIEETNEPIENEDTDVNDSDN